MSRVQKSIAKWVGALVLSFCSFSYSNAQISTTPGQPPIIDRYFYDDTYVHVPLQFGFPFYGRTFTNSWMHSNGVVSFLDPAVPIEGAGYNPGQWAYCCQGIQPSGTRPEFSFMIAPLWTDLYPVGQSRFRTQGDASFQRYYWENIAEISNMNNLNTFGLEIRPSGFIGAYYEKINIQNQITWSGIIGDPTLNQWTEKFYGVPGLNAHLSAIPNWTVNETPADMCVINPLSSPSCPGYATAYFTQQCTVNALYDPQCPGYASAYYNYQCSANPLYHAGCPGYQQAYFDQQCSLDPLYNSQCPGYQQAYFNQQCSLDGLYSQSCPNYADAYYIQQCTLNPLYDTGCTGYETAYFNQQCSLNSLYNNQCPGYQQAYFNQQCSLNPLYANTCPGYATAYFNQQCSLNGLYDRQCPNYAQAYAAQQLLNPPATTSTPVVVATAEQSTTPAVVSDPVVNEVITTTATSASPAQAATATVPLAPAPATTVAAVAPAPAEKKEEKTNDTSKDTSSSSTANTSSSSSEKKEEPKTTRQQLAERRQAAAREKAVEQGKNLANDMGKAATIESQVAVQNVVLSAMGFVPGFDAYGKVAVPDAIGYKPFTIYNNQKNIDNPAGRRFMTGSDRLHTEMVEAQYGK